MSQTHVYFKHQWFLNTVTVSFGNLHCKFIVTKWVTCRMLYIFDYFRVILIDCAICRRLRASIIRIIRTTRSFTKLPAASWQIRKIASCTCAGNAWNRDASPLSRVSDPDMHTEIAFHWSLRRGKRSRHFRQFYVSCKRSMLMLFWSSRICIPSM